MEDKTIREKARDMKLASPHMAAVPEKTRNAALEAVAEAIKADKAAIMAENAKDLKAAEEKGISAPVLKRLKFDDAKLADILSGIESLIGLPDPLNRQLLKRELDSDLILVKESCPIGVIGVIFETRPDAMVQVSTLCIKSGNCVILKGGKVHVTDYTNASRTMIYNIKELKWDEKILKELDIPESMLPEVKDSSEV